jgi:hypothetical protein
MMVYNGIAMIIPVIPKRVPIISITRKISNGCEFTLLEKIIGEEMLLSISCTTKKPMVT